jgi:hypothetical protein
MSDEHGLYRVSVNKERGTVMLSRERDGITSLVVVPKHLVLQCVTRMLLGVEVLDGRVELEDLKVI